MGEIILVGNNRGPKRLRTGYATTKYDIVNGNDGHVNQKDVEQRPSDFGG